MSPTSVRAANSTITPWAKLKTPEALKMRTKPSATSEYMSPAAMPPISTSTRKVGDARHVDERRHEDRVEEAHACATPR